MTVFTWIVRICALVLPSSGVETPGNGWLCCNNKNLSVFTVWPLTIQSCLVLRQILLILSPNTLKSAWRKSFGHKQKFQMYNKPSMFPCKLGCCLPRKKPQPYPLTYPLIKEPSIPNGPSKGKNVKIYAKFQSSFLVWVPQEFHLNLFQASK